MQINEKLTFIEELIAYAEELENTVPGKGAENSNDRDFFLYHLLHRTVRFAKAVVKLTDEAVFCFPECPKFLACEADEAALLNQDDMLERILYERIMMEKR